VNLFTSNIQTSAWESVQPKQPHTCNMIIPLYIRSLIVQKRRARCLWQSSKYPTDKSHYNMLAQKLKRTLANYRNKSYTNHLESLTTKDGSLWKATKQLLRIRNPPAILRNTNGNRYTLMRTKLTYLQTISPILFNLIIPFSFRKKLI